MSWIKEVNDSLRQKVNTAVDALSPEECHALRGGCAVVGLDGFLRGELDQELYTGLLKRGGEMPAEHVLEILDRVKLGG